MGEIPDKAILAQCARIEENGGKILIRTAFLIPYASCLKSEVGISWVSNLERRLTNSQITALVLIGCYALEIIV